MTDIAPPATGTWYDLEETTSTVLAILRLTEQDVDVERIQMLVPVAGLGIDEYLDGTEPVAGPPPPAHVQEALVLRTIDLYRAKDVAAAPPPISDAAQPLLRRSKRRWGVG